MRAADDRAFPTCIDRSANPSCFFISSQARKYDALVIPPSNLLVGCLTRGMGNCGTSQARERLRNASEPGL